MKSNFKVEGLDCANCAAELERQVAKIEGVKEVNINFMMQRMCLEYDENNNFMMQRMCLEYDENNKEEIIKKVKKAIKKEEPDVDIEEI